MLFVLDKMTISSLYQNSSKLCIVSVVQDGSQLTFPLRYACMS